VADFFAHPLALVESADVGRETRIWAWTHVMDGARIGAECNVGEHCFVERGAVLGDRVTVKNGVSIWQGVTAEDDVFFGPNAVLSNDLNPRSKARDWVLARTLLRRGASIGANATLLGGITVGRWALVGAGALVVSDVADHALVVGSPAKQRGWVCECAQVLSFEAEVARCVCGRSWRESPNGVEPA
jgi:acetyltransferase-like isoleucine patch superfamily enzyme